MRHYLVLAIVAVLGGCIPGLDGTESSVKGQDNEGTSDLSNCKIEGSLIGREGAVLEHGKRIVTFHNWAAKAGSPGEYVGFGLTVEGSNTVSYIVKAGTQRFAATAKTWIHPAGVSGGTAAPGISHITFCDCDCDCSSETDGGGDGTDTGGGDSGPILF
jgi:hypothetical protein